MALIFCPECKKQISEHSKVCVNCGYPINPQKENSSQPIIVKNREGCFLTTLNAGCLIFVIIGAIIFLTSIIITGTAYFKNSNKKNSINTEKKIERP